MAARRKSAEVLELVHVGGELVYAVQAYTDGGRHSVHALPALRGAWRGFDAQLNHKCLLPGGAVCSDAWLLRAKCWRRSWPKTLRCSATTKCTGSLWPTPAQPGRHRGRSRLEAVIDLIERYQTALAVLALSTLGFIASGVVLLLLVGRAALERHALYTQAREAEALLGSDRGDARRSHRVRQRGAADAFQRRRPRDQSSAGRARRHRPDLCRAGRVRRAMRGGDSGNNARARVWLQRFRARARSRRSGYPMGVGTNGRRKKTASGRTVGLRIDVTHIKTLQLQGDKARREYQRLVESLADVVFEVDVASGALTFVSTAAADLFGLPAAEMVGTALLDHVHVKDRGCCATPYAASCTAARARCADRLPRPAGSAEGANVVRHVEAPLSPARAGRRQGDRRWRRSRRRRRGAAGATAGAGARPPALDHRFECGAGELTDRNLDMLMVNHEFSVFSGLSSEQAVGRSLHTVFARPI